MRCRQRDAVYLNYILIPKKEKPPRDFKSLYYSDLIEWPEMCRWRDEDISSDFMCTMHERNSLCMDESQTSKRVRH